MPDAPVYRLRSHGFDTSGNLNNSTDFGDPIIATDDVQYTMHYTTFSGQHFMGMDTVTAVPLSSPTTIAAQRMATYSLNGTVPRLSTVSDLMYGGNIPNTGVPGTPWSGQSAGSHTFTYDDATDAFGNLMTVTDPNGYVLTYAYDTTTKSHVTKVTDTFSYVSSTTYNLDFGVPATTTDVNGKVTSYTYDAFGRHSTVVGPLDTAALPTVNVTYSSPGTFPAWSRAQNKDVQLTTDTIDTITFVDGIGRVIQTKKDAEVMNASSGTKTTGFMVSGRVVFDARGRVMAQHQPVFDTGAATTLVVTPSKNPTTYAYDVLGRTLSMSTSDSAVTSTRYLTTVNIGTAEDALPGGTENLALTAVTDPNGHTKRSYSDGTGRMRASLYYNVVGTVRRANTALYSYDVLGHLTTMNGPRAITTASYDSLGRMVSLTNPNVGTTEYRFFGASPLSELVTPAQQRVLYSYDFGRLKTIMYPTLPQVTYTYGASTETGDTAGNLAGRVKSVTMEAGTEQRFYDAYGNVNKTVTTLQHVSGNPPPAAPTVTMKYSYDWMGRMLSLTFPQIVNSSWVVPAGDGEVITYNYDRGGQLKSITGKPPSTASENYLVDIGYDEFGQRIKLTSGNTIANSYTYSPTRRWLTDVSATAKPTSGNIQFHALHFDRDLVGNIQTITNAPPQAAIRPDATPVGVGPLSITNVYDEGDQLTSSTGSYRGHSTFGYRYSATFTLGATGDPLTKAQSQVKTSFAATDTGLTNAHDNGTVAPTTYTLTYNYPAKLGRPTSITEADSTGTIQTRTMAAADANGNNTGDTIGTTTRAITWDEANRVKNVTVNNVSLSQFRYRDDGDRSQKQDGTGKTTFYFNQFLVIDGNRNVTKNIFAGDTRIASKTESTSLTTPVRNFYHPDQVGSTSYISDASQTLVQHERYFPYGERWTELGHEEIATGALRRDYLFTGKELDRDTGFYYFGARYLDPRTDMWLSGDPILASYMKGSPNGGVSNPRNVGLYNYAYANPVGLRDPDGRATGYDSGPAIAAKNAAIAAEAQEAAAANAQAGRMMARGGGFGASAAFYLTNHGHPEAGNSWMGKGWGGPSDAYDKIAEGTAHFPHALYHGLVWGAVGGVGQAILGGMVAGAALGEEGGEPAARCSTGR